MAERHTSTEQVELVQDPDERARREAENGIRQTELALEIIRAFVHDKERPFRLRQGILMQLHAKALEGIPCLLGRFGMAQPKSTEAITSRRRLGALLTRSPTSVNT